MLTEPYVWVSIVDKLPVAVYEKHKQASCKWNVWFVYFLSEPTTISVHATAIYAYNYNIIFD